ncbi:hypothetical protein NPIL_218101 [Nephila pilipes]|uniref:Uncharacterized protein n=1 Tax=Nephila pilipes TaxID=299642 RepID=A0A8X6P4R1_NEPPI|nr:hypothetical protein NPIL_218101 [Nephila pilipes]
MLADKLDAFDNIWRSLPSGPRRHVKACETLNDGKQVTSRKFERLPKKEHSHVIPNEDPLSNVMAVGDQGYSRIRDSSSGNHVSNELSRGSTDHRRILHKPSDGRD